MGKLKDFFTGDNWKDERIKQQNNEIYELKQRIESLEQNSYKKQLKHQEELNKALTGNMTAPLYEKLRNDYVSVCNERSDLQYKLQRYENTDIDFENKRLRSEIKCMKFKIEELEREKEEFIKLLDRYDVFFKTLSKE